MLERKLPQVFSQGSPPNGIEPEIPGPIPAWNWIQNFKKNILHTEVQKMAMIVKFVFRQT